MAAAENLLPGDSGPGESPYPGLRSFQPDDSDYFFGREDQVADVVERLRRNRFVAVLGGSGSGKSSLVLAGAIPRLRSAAIRDAGDLWVPVISTPGTNLTDGNTPLTRLARRFCGELIGSGDPATRIEECTALLRRQNGFGLIVERFGPQLRNPGGLDLASPHVQVNFLLLIDQFEELFHPSNLESSIAVDCAHLANRIIEQFRHRHGQVCVALTMRSEHLNDCPRYQDLPDAINSSGYLVKRLVGAELKRAIEEPAQRFLDKCRAATMSANRRARCSGAEAPVEVSIPDEIPFSTEVLDRLMSDSKAVFAQKDHADHLPLLQHLLFWVWRVACARTQGRVAPDRIALEDLCTAVVPDGCSDEGLDESINTLEACLENRCAAIFEQHPQERTRWERAFRSLAFKEPNSGSYTQQRMAMDGLGKAMSLGDGDIHSLQRSLLPWLVPHGYLHWDEASRTVKVAHETLIRRWSSFRKWIDEEDAQFQVYVRLLEDCARWRAGGEESYDLSIGVALRRYEDAAMLAALRDNSRAGRLERLLAMDRDGERLEPFMHSALQFLERSKEQDNQQKQALARAQQAERDREVLAAKTLAAEARVLAAEAAIIKAEAGEAEALARTAAADAVSRVERERTKRHRLKMRVIYPLLALLVLGLVHQYVRSKVLSTDHDMNVSYRVSTETALRLSTQNNGFREQHWPLYNMLTGARVFLEERSNPWSDPWPLIGTLLHDDVTSMKRSAELAELRHIAGLRSVLYSAPWKVAATNDKWVGEWVPCKSIDGFIFGAKDPSEFRFFRRKSPGSQGLIVHDSTLTIFAGEDANVAPGTTDCVIQNHLLTAPSTERVELGITGDLTHLVLTFENSFQLYQVMWTTASTTVQLAATVVMRFDADKFLPKTRSLKIAQRRFARDIELNENTTIRVFDPEPSAFTSNEAREGEPFVPLNRGDLCDRIADRYWRGNTQATTAWDGQLQESVPGQYTFCLHVSRAPIRSGSATAEYVATLYRFDSDSPIGGSQHLPMMEQAQLGTVLPTEFRLHSLRGWLAFKEAEDRWVALPWGLNEFVRLAVDVFEPEGMRQSERGRYGRVFDVVLDPEHTAVAPRQLKNALGQVADITPHVE